MFKSHQIKSDRCFNNHRKQRDFPFLFLFVAKVCSFKKCYLLKWPDKLEIVLSLFESSLRSRNDGPKLTLVI